MPRPPVIWIYLYHSTSSWHVAIQRLNGHHRIKTNITPASRHRLTEVLATICRRPAGTLPLFVVRPHPDGWCAYPAPGKASTPQTRGKELHQCPTSAA